MQAVILAAGRGKRMGHLTLATTKPMLKIKGKPILEHKLSLLPKKIKEIIFVVGYHSTDIISHFKRYFGGRRITYVFQNHLNGTGGALYLARSVLREKFLVLMGDDLYSKGDIVNLMKHELAVLGFTSDKAENFGVIKTGRGKTLDGFLEKPKNIRRGLVNTGAYILDKRFFEHELVPISGGELSLPHTLLKMSAKHKVKVETAEFWHPINCPADLKKAEEILPKLV